mgnify:CR=1 FL=1
MGSLLSMRCPRSVPACSASRVAGIHRSDRRGGLQFLDAGVIGAVPVGCKASTTFGAIVHFGQPGPREDWGVE